MRMSRRGWKLAAYALAGLFFLLGACRPEVPPPLPAPVVDQPNYQTERVIADALNVRRSPSNKGEILTVLQKGSMVEIAGRDGDWVQILTPRRQYGWVYGAYLTGFHKGKKRSSATGKKRPAIPQGVGNSGPPRSADPAYPVQTPAGQSNTVSPQPPVQGDDFPSGFDGAAE